MVKIVIVFDSIIVVFVIVRGVVAVVVSVRLVFFSVNFVKADVVIGFEFACLYDMYLSVGVSLGVVFAAIVDPVIFKVVGVFLFVKVVVFSVHVVGVRIGSVCSYVLYSVDLVVLI